MAGGVVAGTVSFHTRAMKANLLNILTVLLGATALASCADQRMIPAPAQTPGPLPPRSAPLPPPASRATDWRDEPITPGTWQWSMTEGQSVARFAAGRLTLRCDLSQRAIHIERSEAGSGPPSPALMTIVTQTQMRPFNAAAQGGAVAVTIAARDPILDAMAFSRGRFVVEVAGWPTLYVPSWTEVSRVIEDCR